MNKPEFILRTEDHPEANGGKPKVGDAAYEIRFPLEDGRELVVKLGQKGFDKVTDLLMDMLTEAPSHHDGTTNVNAGTPTTDTARLNAIERIGIELVPRSGQWNCLIADGPRSQTGVSSRRCIREAIDLAVYQLDKAGITSAELK